MMMMMMKKPIVLMTCLLLVSSLAIVASHSGPAPRNCCFGFVTRKLKKTWVENYRFTDPQCANPAVIFTMKKGSQLCADASEGWVEKIMDYIDYIENQKPNSTASTY
ncbi:C-C motif chemokine 4 [Nibea albiflora]|uniref:C-C motif chemokine 4 n=1 Tax=Nibea albiflora TaxID=240163 RepID=A0ACB7FB08_NIBAL|nr:C-C motif chemokine 4 [Nibea albiflora]